MLGICIKQTSLIINFEKRQKISHFGCLNVGIERLKRKKKWMIYTVCKNKINIVFKIYKTHSACPWIILCLRSPCFGLGLGFVGSTAITQAGVHHGTREGVQSRVPRKRPFVKSGPGGTSQAPWLWAGMVSNVLTFCNTQNPISSLSETLGSIPGLFLLSQMMDCHIPVTSTTV